MDIIQTPLKDVLIVKPKIFRDERGFFFETYQETRYFEAGIGEKFVQDNHSGSLKGTLRGLHYQIIQPQGKLIRVTAGIIFDVAVDLRRNSSSFGKWWGITISAEDKQQFWIPCGFAHGFYVISEWAEVVYKVTGYYSHEGERTILWNDPELNIQWPIPEGQEPILSAKDTNGSLFTDAEVFK
jgi:dTDP-4-dehydrorhamnose 3,5-epimerase